MTSSSATTILISGTSGDLTTRNLIPALFRLLQQHYLSSRCPVIGVARRPKSHDEFRPEMRDRVTTRLGDDTFNAAAWDVSRMIPPRESESLLRVVVEKPIDRDLKSAQELTVVLSRYLQEGQICRIDHSLGKETGNRAEYSAVSIRENDL